MYVKRTEEVNISRIQLTKAVLLGKVRRDKDSNRLRSYLQLW